MTENPNIPSQDQMETTLAKQYELLKKQSEELKRSRIGIIEALATLVEYRGIKNGDHIRHVRDLTIILANQVMNDYPEYGLTEEKIHDIAMGSLLHDIGKIAIPDNIILNPGELTEEESEIMKSHTTKGEEIMDELQGIVEEQYWQAAIEIIRSHHERFDGNGYPDGLSEDNIPISAQIVSLADQYDVLLSDRITKKADTKDVAFQKITTGVCGVFSPKLLDCLHKCIDKFEAIY